MVRTHLHTQIILHMLFSYIHQIMFSSRQKNLLVNIAYLATLPVRALAHINTYAHTYMDTNAYNAKNNNRNEVRKKIRRQLRQKSARKRQWIFAPI